MSHIVRFVAICLGAVLLGCSAEDVPPRGQVERDAQAYFDNVTCSRSVAAETPTSKDHPQTLLQLVNQGRVELKIMSIERDQYERDLAYAKVIPVAERESLWFYAFALAYQKSRNGWKLMLAP